MEKNKRAAIVLDANVVIATLIRYGGFTSKILKHAGKHFDVFVPNYLWKEINKHVKLLAKKSGLSIEEVKLAIDILSRRFKIAKIKETDVAHLEVYVKDPKDSQYVAAAVGLRKNYETVIILTYNKKDFDVPKLKNIGIIVLTPKEFIAFLRENVA
ncbi:MAG: hypothetical protein GXO00_02115 [Candidatus Diapherotrites archaeon]|nr:hypothetical protein [Candidatus Diapherotrites archaeon]